MTEGAAQHGDQDRTAPPDGDLPAPDTGIGLGAGSPDTFEPEEADPPRPDGAPPADS
ncbi:hypothetical protein [Nakamurella endophytica]|nr:hypothetical protein [Nakamurella endophytica]